MKNLILLFILLPFTVFAKFYTGSITFNNEKKITGFVEIPNYDDSKICFRFEKNGSTEKYVIEDVKGFEIINEESQVLKYITLVLSRPKLLKPHEMKMDKQKSWVCLIKEGGINLYSAYYYIISGRTISSGYKIYVKKENEEFGRYL